METTRVKINLKSGEIEIEGSEAFVENQMDNLDSIIDLLSSVQEEPINTITHVPDNGSAPAVIAETISSDEDASVPPGDILVPSSFGEWMHNFKDEVNDLEKCLLTAYYVQKGSPENDFKTSEVNKSLKEHGIKLSNPSTSLKRLVEKKLLFQTRKSGKLRLMRVSQDGMTLLRSLLR